MQAKIKFINEKIDDKGRQKNSNAALKLDQLQKKAKKLEQKWKKQHEDRM